MWQWLDVAVVLLIVLLAGGYAVFSLGTAQLRKRVLNWIGRHLGVRTVMLLMPRQKGCGGCGGQIANDPAASLRKRHR